MVYFRFPFSKVMRFTTQWGIFFILLLGIPRFVVVLGANVTGNYNYTSLIFIAMWLLPIILLNKDGRTLIGIKKPRKFTSLVWSFLIGVLICIPVFLLGQTLYADQSTNWFVYISQSYKQALPQDLTDTRSLYFVIFASIAMVFSPLGEELMYRGFIHQCFEEEWGPNRASLIDSSAFALTHLAHFGILYTPDGWMFEPIPALLWVLCTFFASRVFFYCKRLSSSIAGAILAHAGFNLAMTYFIFYFIF